MIPVSNQFAHLNKRNLFKRWDLMPRYLAIENHFGENDYGWELFRKLRIHQSSEFGEGHSQKLYDQSVRDGFERLIESVKVSGYDRSYPLVLNEDKLLITKGWLRFACCLYFEIEEIPCKFDVIDPDPNYSLNWMQTDVGYDSREINLIVNCRDRLFEKIKNKILCDSTQ
jgi:hypothetical protein